MKKYINNILYLVLLLSGIFLINYANKFQETHNVVEEKIDKPVNNTNIQKKKTEEFTITIDNNEYLSKLLKFIKKSEDYDYIVNSLNNKINNLNQVIVKLQNLKINLEAKINNQKISFKDKPNLNLIPTETNSFYPSKSKPKIKTKKNKFENMVLVKSGKFLYNKKMIKLKSFWIDKYEVTNKEFKKVFKNFDYPKGQDNYPVSQVSYFEALNYAKSIGKDLPTVEQWEKAAGWNDKTKKNNKYSWGNKFKKSFANTAENGTYLISTVGSYKKDKSFYNIFDMIGNVAEWTKTPGFENKNFMICKGASILNYKENAEIKSFDELPPNNKYTAVGFRCVINLKD